MYQIAYSISVEASGGAQGGYMYKFDIIQNDMETSSTGWVYENGASGELSGNGTCFLRISVQDTEGNIVANDYDLLS